MHPVKLIKICISVCLKIIYADVLLLHLCLIKKNIQVILMWAVKVKNCVKNTVNKAKFVNFNTVFLKKYHSAHHFSFKSSLANLLGNKVTDFYQKHWFLIFKVVAQRFELKADENSQFSFWFLTFSNNYPKIFFCFLAVLRGANNFHEKKPWDVVVFLRNIARK